MNDFLTKTLIEVLNKKTENNLTVKEGLNQRLKKILETGSDKQKEEVQKMIKKYSIDISL